MAGRHENGPSLEDSRPFVFNTFGQLFAYSRELENTEDRSVNPGRGCCGAIEDVQTPLFLFDKPGAFEHREVFRRRGEREADRFCDI